MFKQYMTDLCISASKKCSYVSKWYRIWYDDNISTYTTKPTCTFMNLSVSITHSISLFSNLSIFLKPHVCWSRPPKALIPCYHCDLSLASLCILSANLSIIVGNRKIYSHIWHNLETIPWTLMMGQMIHIFIWNNWHWLELNVDNCKIFTWFASLNLLYVRACVHVVFPSFSYFTMAKVKPKL